MKEYSWLKRTSERLSLSNYLLCDFKRHAAEPGTFLAGIELYRTRPDKGYSLTDYISTITMRREGLTEALTNDRHFERAA